MKHSFFSLRVFLFAILLTNLFSMVNAQTATIDFRLYTAKTHPFMIPNLPDASEFYLVVKTGNPIYLAITGMDKGTGEYYRGTAPSRVITGDTILLDFPSPGNWLINYKENNVVRAIGLHLTSQADLQDQTVGSVSFGNYPDFIWVQQGGSATVNEGKNFGYYRWRNLDESIITLGYTDSIKTVSFGNYICEARDLSGILPNGLTRDTISILENPTLNNTTKTLNFPTTAAGITYKLLKVGSINGTDTTWTETQNFVGDGNIKNITLTDGKYKLTTTLGIHTSVYPYGYFVVSTTTAVEKTKEENINYRLVDNKLLFDNEVNLKIYSLQGQLLQQGQGSSFKLSRQAGIFKATDKNGNLLTAKIIL